MSFKSAVVFPKVSTELFDEALSIENLPPFTGKLKRAQMSKSTKFPDLSKSTRTCRGESVSSVTTVDSKLEGAEARKGWFTDGTEVVISAEAV